MKNCSEDETANENFKITMNKSVSESVSLHFLLLLLTSPDLCSGTVCDILDEVENASSQSEPLFTNMRVAESRLSCCKKASCVQHISILQQNGQGGGGGGGGLAISQIFPTKTLLWLNYWT